MRVLILGANGFIGSAVTARLHATHQVVAVTRRSGGSGLLPVAELVIDIARATRVQDWLPHLRGIDAVVNCAGVFQDSPNESTSGVHVEGATALFRACEQLGVRRVIQISAVGVDRETPTEFSRTKLAGDDALMSCDLDWVILRPSVVIGRAAYGGSALFRGLAALPIVPILSESGPLQIVHLDDLVAAIAFFLRPDAPVRRAIDIVGPRQWSLEEVVLLFRNWLRFRPAPTVRLPAWLSAGLYRLGDGVSLLGWRPPVRSTARREIVRGAVGDANTWTKMTGINPRDLETALASEPASVQERWFAMLYFLKPFVFGVLALFWIATGLIALGPGFSIGKNLIEEGGASEFATIGVIAGALADIAIGLGIAVRSTARPALYGALAISLVYALLGTILVPRLWIDPLGPMLKIWPVLVLNLVALAILDDR